MTEPALDLQHVSVGYYDKTVVRDVTMRLDRGETVALLGTNGSGKSTLVKGILGLATVLAGRIDVFGHPDDRAGRRGIGYVPQRLSAGGPIPATVREVVLTGRLARRRWFVRSSAADRAAVERALQLVNLTDYAKVAVTELSGGQHRRVLIARALAGHPDLLIMDEPTAGIDASQQHTFVATMHRLQKIGVTMLVVTHEIGPLLPVLSRAAVLDEGRLTYDGPIGPYLHGRGDAGDHHHHDEMPARLLPDLSVSPPGAVT